jgi:hypothetical protein
MIRREPNCRRDVLLRIDATVDLDGSRGFPDTAKNRESWIQECIFSRKNLSFWIGKPVDNCVYLTEWLLAVQFGDCSSEHAQGFPQVDLKEFHCAQDVCTPLSE